jgi:hypothetical protein
MTVEEHSSNSFGGTFRRIKEVELLDKLALRLKGAVVKLAVALATTTRRDGIRIESSNFAVQLS